MDCTAPAGSFSALIGPNGAGKSTLLRAIAAAQKTSAGTIGFDGDDLLALPRRRRAQIVSLVEQDASTELALTRARGGGPGAHAVPVALGRGWPRRPRRRRAEPDAPPRWTRSRTRDFTTLSGGERQRVLLAKALAQQPRLLLLDEPTNHLDISAQLATLRLLSSLARSGVSVLAALHDLGLAAAASDHLIVLRRGRVISGGTHGADPHPRAHPRRVRGARDRAPASDQRPAGDRVQPARLNGASSRSQIERGTSAARRRMRVSELACNCAMDRSASPAPTVVMSRVSVDPPGLAYD